MASADLIRTQLEAKLAGRIPVPFAQCALSKKQVLPTGIGAIDAAMGGIPFGEITEIVSPSWSSSGGKSLQSRLLASATRLHCCALVDATDSFDPKSAQAAGVNLRRLLWIRCSGQGMKALEQAFKSADLLLQGSGGFGLLIVDLTGIAEKCVRKVPSSTWFRFRGVAEKLEAPLVFVTPHAVVGTCSSLTLHLFRAQIEWSQPTSECPAHARLPVALDFAVQIAARRSCKKLSQSVGAFSAQRQWA